MSGEHSIFLSREAYASFLEGNLQNVPQTFLDKFFGEGSVGESLQERSRSSKLRWVRSQDQLALYSEGATGMQMSTEEVVELFGLRVMDEVYESGGAVLVADHSEPAASIKRVRESKSLTQEELAQLACVTIAEAQDAENENKRNSIWMLDKICKVLGIDTRLIGFKRFS